MKQIPDHLRADIAFLTFAASNELLPTYVEHGLLHNNSARGHQHRLEDVNEWCRDNGFPQLSVIVVATGTKLPAAGAFTGRWEDYYKGWTTETVRQEQIACYKFDWATALKNLRSVVAA